MDTELPEVVSAAQRGIFPNPCAAFNCSHTILFILKFQVALKGRQEVLVKKETFLKGEETLLCSPWRGAGILFVLFVLRLASFRWSRAVAVGSERVW